MDAVEWSTSIYALAAAHGPVHEFGGADRASLLLTQLGTIAALRELEETGETVEEI